MKHDRMDTHRQQVIRRLMARAGVSESQVALVMGASRNTLRNKLASDRLSVPELDRIARALGTRASAILAEAEASAQRIAS